MTGGLAYFHDRRSCEHHSKPMNQMKASSSDRYFQHKHDKNIFEKQLIKNKYLELNNITFLVIFPRTSVDRENVQAPLSSSSRILFVQLVCVLKLGTGCLVMEFLRSGLHQNLRVELFNVQHAAEFAKWRP